MQQISAATHCAVLRSRGRRTLVLTGVSQVTRGDHHTTNLLLETHHKPDSAGSVSVSVSVSVRFVVWWYHVVNGMSHVSLAFHSFF
jgi:hypothetical protein